jgi:hypothetical protein
MKSRRWGRLMRQRQLEPQPNTYSPILAGARRPLAYLRDRMTFSLLPIWIDGFN